MEEEKKSAQPVIDEYKGNQFCASRLSMIPIPKHAAPFTEAPQAHNVHLKVVNSDEILMSERWSNCLHDISSVIRSYLLTI